MKKWKIEEEILLLLFFNLKDKLPLKKEMLSQLVISLLQSKMQKP